MKCPQVSRRQVHRPSSPVSPCPPAARAYFGSVLSPAQRCLTCLAYGQENCPPALCGSKASRNLELLATCIGNLSARSPRRRLYTQLRECSEEQSMPNYQDQKLLPPTAARLTPELMDPGNGVQNPFVETAKRTGSLYGPPPSPDLSVAYPFKYEYATTGTLDALEPIIWRLEQLFARFT